MGGALIMLTLSSPYRTNAAGNQYYVDSNLGSDSNNGSFSKPWKTLQKAADTVVAGDTVYIRQGVYSSMSLKKSGSPGNYITFQAYPGERPIIDGGGWAGITDYYATTSPLQYYIIDGIEITNDEFGFFITKSNNFILKNNIIHHQSNTGISIDNASNSEIAYNTVYGISSYNGIWLTHSSYNNIHHNITHSNNENGIGLSFDSNYNKIHHNRSYGNSCGQDQRYGGIAVEVSSSNNEIYLNLIYNNCHSGYVTNSPSNKIYHNVLYGNTEFQALLGDWSGSSPVNNEFTNNIFYVTRSTDRAIGYFKDSITYDPLQNNYDYNLYYYVNGPDKSNMVQTLSRSYTFAEWKSIGKETHGVLGNPGFISASTNDFHITNQSPCVDRGKASGLIVDFDDNPSPQGAGYDIGAYEEQNVNGATATIPPSYTPTTQYTNTPTVTASKTASPTNTPTPTIVQPTRTNTPTSSFTPVPPSPTQTPSMVQPTRTNTPTPSFTPVISSPTPTYSRTPTLSPSPTWTPVYSPTATPSATLQSTATPTTQPTQRYDIIVDNLDGGFHLEYQQDQWELWTDVNTQHYKNSHYYNHTIGSGNDIASWTFEVPVSGYYEVYAMWWAGSWRPPDVPYIIEDKNGISTVRVNQQINGGSWVLLGKFEFDRYGKVTISDAASSGEDIVADAIRVVYVSPSIQSYFYKLFLPMTIR